MDLKPQNKNHPKVLNVFVVCREPGKKRELQIFTQSAFLRLLSVVFLRLLRIFMKGLDPLEVGRRPAGPSSKRPPSVIFRFTTSGGSITRSPVAQQVNKKIGIYGASQKTPQILAL